MTERLDRFANQFLVDKGTVSFRRIKKSDALLMSIPDCLNTFGCRDWRARAETQIHTAHTKG